MQKVNYQLEMERMMGDIPAGTGLLLHSCCGPCSTAVLERLAAHFHVSLLFYNPNIWPRQEFEHRLQAQTELLQALPTTYPVKLLEMPYNHEEFLRVAAGLEQQPEGGTRCARCFALRLGQAAQMASQHGLPWFTTTLSVSPHKNAPLLNQLGAAAGKQYHVGYLCADFKKKDGYRRSVQLANEFGLYRQDYCGCEFSLAARQKQQAQGVAAELF